MSDIRNKIVVDRTALIFLEGPKGYFKDKENLGSWEVEGKQKKTQALKSVERGLKARGHA